MDCPLCKYNPGKNDTSGIPFRMTYGEFYDVSLVAGAYRNDKPVRKIIGCPRCNVIFMEDWEKQMYDEMDL